MDRRHRNHRQRHRHHYYPRRIESEEERFGDCSSTNVRRPSLLLSIYGKEERSFMLPESKFPVTGKFERIEEAAACELCELIYDGVTGPVDHGPSEHPFRFFISLIFLSPSLSIF